VPLRFCRAAPDRVAHDVSQRLGVNLAHDVGALCQALSDCLECYDVSINGTPYAARGEDLQYVEHFVPALRTSAVLPFPDESEPSMRHRYASSGVLLLPVLIALPVSRLNAQAIPGRVYLFLNELSCD